MLAFVRPFSNFYFANEALNSCIMYNSKRAYRSLLQSVRPLRLQAPMVCPLFLKFDLPFCLLFSFHFSFVRMYCNVRCFSSSVIHYFRFCVLDILYVNWFSLVVLFSCTSWKTVVELYLLGGLYLSFYRFFGASLPTFFCWAVPFLFC